VRIADLDLGNRYDHILCITASPLALSILNKVRRSCATLQEVGFRASTGKLVWNRLKPHLRNEPSETALPLYWIHNIKPFKFLPDALNGKHLPHAELNSSTQPWLNTPDELVVTKRISAKEQKRRIEAALIPATWRNDTRGYFLENHVNFITRTARAKITSRCLMGILNSKLLDFVFRLFNGNTQVSATELNLLPIACGPACKKIEELAGMLTEAPEYEIPKLEQALNAAVYRNYGLRKREQDYVENFFRGYHR